MLKRATWCRTDIWFGRYIGHPLTALAYPTAAVVMIALLCITPAVDIGWLWVAFVLGPGVWMFVAGMLFNMALLGRLLDMPASAALFSGAKETWPEFLFRREALASILLLAMVPATITWYSNRPFDNQDFRHCIARLGSESQAKLAKTVTASSTRDEFRTACFNAMPPRVPFKDTSPKTFEELQQRVAASKE